MSEPIYHVVGLRKSYGGRVVLDDLSFDIRRGECLVIMGRSGSGKSVTLRQLNGLESPDRGEIWFDGQEITRLRERELLPMRRRVSTLFQSGALFDSLTVAENVGYPLHEHSDRTDDEIAAAVADKLALVGLPGIEELMPSSLSGGMKKRVALARALALDPEVVLFDEPTTGLDPITAATIGGLIVSARARLGATSAVVTHDVPLARRVGDRVAFLHQGTFRFLGSWREADETSDQLLSDFLHGREEHDAA